MIAVLIMVCTETRLFELACKDAKFYHKGDKYGTHDYYKYHLLGVVPSAAGIILHFLL